LEQIGAIRWIACLSGMDEFLLGFGGCLVRLRRIRIWLRFLILVRRGVHLLMGGGRVRLRLMPFDRRFVCRGRRSIGFRRREVLRLHVGRIVRLRLWLMIVW